MMADKLALERIQRFFKKLESGADLRIGFVGGSITTGYAAPEPLLNGWAGLLGTWFSTEAQRFGSRVTIFNRGVSGTDSASGAVRIQEHIHRTELDLVIVEFAMNDQWLDPHTRRQTFEGCLRQILARQDLAVLVLFVNERGQPDRGQAQEQKIITDWYGVPSLRWSDHVRGDSWPDFFPPEDPIHPNGRGHQHLARTLETWIQELRSADPGDQAERKALSMAPLVPALYSTDWQYARYLDSRTHEPTSNRGFVQGSVQHGEWLAHGGAPLGWHSKEDGAEMTLSVRGKVLALLVAESEHFRNMEAWLDDDATPTLLQGHEPIRVGYLGWKIVVLGRNLSQGDHILHVRMSQDQWQGSGREAQLCAVLCAGIPEEQGVFRQIEAPLARAVQLKPNARTCGVLGRTDPSRSDALGISWQGTQVAVGIKGQGLTLEFAEVHDRNWFDIEINGCHHTLLPQAGTGSIYRFTGPLPDHGSILRITKRSEGVFGYAYLKALWLDEGGTFLAPEPFERPLIEFYGDSITAGACIEDGHTDQYDTLASHDNLLSYGAIAARRLNLDYHNFAVSGTGLTCSWNPIILPEVFDRWWPDPAAASVQAPADQSRHPAFVVVNLGQNDYGFPSSTGKEMSPDYSAKLTAFLAVLRKRYPRSKIIAALGGMTAVEESTVLRQGFLKSVEAMEREDQGFSWMIFKASSSAHPRFDIHARMAEELVAHIKHIQKA